MSQSSDILALFTPRLTLRPMCVDDSPRVRTLICRNLKLPSTTDGFDPCRYYVERWRADGLSKFSVFERVTGTFVGFVGPLRLTGWPAPEIGWSINQGHRGLGYATEASRATIDWVFRAHKCSEIIHFISEENYSSQRVAEKLGSKKGWLSQLPQDIAFGPSHPGEVWGQSRAQWEASLHGPPSA
jgi:RimJ/RimL family protein N-acetyltransferase